VWGPVAGYYNKTTLGGAYQIIPVAGPGLQWQVAIGVRKGSEQLRAALDRELERLLPEILRLADKYGFPLTPPVNLGFQTDAVSSLPREGAPSPARTAANPFSGNGAVITAGRSLFNQYCAHCHSPNAMNPEPSTDLRRLERRYGHNVIQVFYTTVTEGRPAKGMPPWKEVLREEQIWKILTFLESVQHKP
jgi:cytochrome c553